MTGLSMTNREITATSPKLTIGSLRELTTVGVVAESGRRTPRRCWVPPICSTPSAGPRATTRSARCSPRWHRCSS